MEKGPVKGTLQAIKSLRSFGDCPFFCLPSASPPFSTKPRSCHRLVSRACSSNDPYPDDPHAPIFIPILSILHVLSIAPSLLPNYLASLPTSPHPPPDPQCLAQLNARSTYEFFIPHEKLLNIKPGRSTDSHLSKTPP